ncbi:sensor domain-containing diguanylate cyclase [Aminipila terrae]|uniref:Diguanylate cyclase n=1 Tax=Aminipila terrae TaxID=2697030 RepID=A0A6P1MH83_9FIRM|nr:diguanylate cyclase [Aminipila terrae]QHI73412.1 diguanylate cyclase [Aminipila terrae]
MCTENQDIASLGSKDYNLIYELWPKPLSDGLIRFNFTRLQKQLKLTKDFQLTQNYLDTLIDSVPDLIWFKDVRGSHLKVNQSFCDTVGKTKEDITGRGHYYIWGLEPEEYEKGEYVCMETDEIVLREKKTFLFDEKVKCKNEMRQFKTYKSPILNNSGTAIGTVGIARDVTALKNIQMELDILIQNMPFAMLITDKNRNILNVNNRYLDIFSLKKSDLIGETISSFQQKYGSIAGGKNWSLHKTKRGLFLHGDNKIFRIQKEKLIDIFGEVSGYLFLHIDVTFEDNYENKLIQAANTDYLTKLNNRRGLANFLTQHTFQHQTTLILIDFDNFKTINDQYGHAEGDQILIAFSSILLELFPGNNIFRLGGDEFLVILLDISDRNIIEEYAQTIINQFKAKISGTTSLQNASVSIGIAINENETLEFKDLFKRADVALYESKHLGKSRYSIWKYIDSKKILL